MTNRAMMFWLLGNDKWLPPIPSGAELIYTQAQVSGDYIDQSWNWNDGEATSVTDSTVGGKNIMTFTWTSSIDSPLIIAQSYSVAFTFKRDSAWGDIEWIIHEQRTSNIRYQMGFWTSWRIFCSSWDNWILFSSDISLLAPQGTTNTIVFTSESGNMEIFLNWQSVGTSTTTYTLNAFDDFLIGRGWGAWNFYNWDFNDFYVWNRKLTSQEVSDFFDNV